MFSPTLEVDIWLIDAPNGLYIPLFVTNLQKISKQKLVGYVAKSDTKSKKIS
jgi:hypothetical protein